ncbi:MAG TPA: DUF1028 domain-containing protein [Actinomycetota bacterium]|nr:DUF1028 domain-containing protein [Actinomycetota bacterium]
MTFSIVAADPDAGDWGIAVASKFPCVGAVVPWARAGVGAVATQAWANTSFGPDGLALMGEGVAAEDALRRLLDADEGRADRQVGLVDARGRAATFTGEKCMVWAGGIAGDGFAAQGNILVRDEVVKEVARAFRATEGDLSDRLLAALLAGDAAGGDRRGRQSAALLVVREGGGYEGRNDRYVDLRVDDHPDAPTELARLFEVWDATMLVRNDPLLPASPDLVADIQRRLAAIGRFEGDSTGVYDDATRDALAGWAGEVNLEGRLRDDEEISNQLVMELRDITPEVPAESA